MVLHPPDDNKKAAKTATKKRTFFLQLAIPVGPCSFASLPCDRFAYLYFQFNYNLFRNKREHFSYIHRKYIPILFIIYHFLSLIQ